MIALATPPDILDQASAYARVMLLTMPLGFVFLLMTAMMRSVGDTLTPLVALATCIAFASGVVGLLVSYHFGAPSGPAIILVAGAAYAVSVLIGPAGGIVTARVQRRHLEA